jgi:hypothetical protein
MSSIREEPALPTEALEPFLDEGLITGVVRPIKSGKEASLHLCRSDPRVTGERLLGFEVIEDAGRLAADLWTAWTFADLIPGDLSV